MNENPLKEETEDGLRFRVLEGGKKILAPALAGKEPTSICWLRDLAEGTIFLVKDKTNKMNFLQDQYEIVEKTNTSVKLFTMSTQPIFLWVEPFRFCNRFDLVEVLGTRKEEIPND